MATPAIKKKYVSVHYDDWIEELNNIQGPIFNPVWIDIDIIRKMIYNGKEVREHCITDPVKYVRLTKANYDDYTIYPGNAEIIDPSVKPNTYLLTLQDKPIREEDMVAGYIYVELV